MAAAQACLISNQLDVLMLLKQDMPVLRNQRENKIIHKQINVKSALKSAVALCK